MTDWPGGRSAITLFAEDLPTTRQFYVDVFGLPLVFADDDSAACRELTSRGVELLNGPVDRPWGPRTASFRDPAGHIWEIAG